MKVFGRSSGIAIFVALALVAVIELITRQGGDFSFHRWREFEWLFLVILAVWFILRRNNG